MNAYDESYVAGAQARLGAAFDTATRLLGLELGGFYRLFLDSPLSRRFGAGDPAIVAGSSGVELALRLAVAGEPPSTHLRSCAPPASASREYWTGWALAFYQWASGIAFESIEKRVPVTQVRELYAPYHEMDVRQFCDRMDELVLAARPQTNLQALRRAAGLSQRQLAEAARVPVRTLQQYEQRQKNINRARADYVSALARALCCSPGDLLERSAGETWRYEVVEL